MASVPAEKMSRFFIRCIWVLLTLFVLGFVFELAAPLSHAPAASPTGGLMAVTGGAADYVAEIAAKVGWLILPVVMLWLLIRGLPEPAAYVAAAEVGIAILLAAGMLQKTLHRAMAGTVPEDGTIYSSGSLQLTVVCGVLLLVFLPAIPARSRPRAVAGSATAVLVFDTIRLLAGTAALGPVIAGWLTGLGWLAATFRAFRKWQQHPDLRRPWWHGLPVKDRAALAPAPLRDAVLPGGRSAAFKLAGVWVLIATGVAGAGLLITEVLAPVRRMDQAVVHWLVEHRNDTFSTLAPVAGSFGTTAGIIGLLLVSAPLALAITRRAAPAAFLLVAVAGETALYLAAAMIVSRTRPGVDHLSEGLPPTASFPSGRVAATVVMYGGLALLLRTWTRPILRNLGLILAPLLVLGVALSRMYWGVHYPTDTGVSIIFATVWLYACWRYFQPARGAPGQVSTRKKPAAAGSGRTP
jgi:undecaprenyl-diphosphatase